MGQIGNVGILFVQFLLTVVLAATLYATGELATLAPRALRSASCGCRRRKRGLARRTDDSRCCPWRCGNGTAQTALGGAGLVLAGVPFAAILTVAMFLLCIAQIGVVLVLAGAVAWLYWTGQSGAGTFMLVWTIVVGGMDNFLRPILIRRGADLPLLLVFAGVIGGLLAFGLIGIFIGPVVLAVADKLLTAWIDSPAYDAASEVPGE